MRKNGRTIVFALLLLLVPVLANAWTLATRVSGSSSDGAVYIQDDKVNVDADGALLALDPAAAATYIAKLQGGPASVQLTGNAIVSVELQPYKAADVVIDYVKTVQENPTDAPVLGAAYAPIAPGSGHSLNVAWGQAASKMGNVSVNKNAGGTVLLQYNGASSMTGFTNLAFGTTVGIKVSPRTDFRVKSIDIQPALGNTGFDEADEIAPLLAGQAKVIPLVVTNSAMTVTAEYELVPNARPMLSAPLKAVAGKPLTLSAAGTTANAAVTYEFVVGGSSKQNTSSPSFTFTPFAAGELTVALNVKSGSTTLATKTVTINVVSDAVAYNGLCIGCHTGSTPAVIAAYNDGTHGGPSVSCVSCHTDSPHAAVPAMDPAAPHSGLTSADKSTCGACHQTIAATFATSLHGTRPGKGTFYNDGLGETNPAPLQQGFGNFVDVDYSTLPCADCHSAAWTVDGVDTWTEPTCVDCHGNVANGQTTTLVDVPVAKDTCYGCHARQAYEGTAFGLTDVHGSMACSSCHATTDFHGDGTSPASQLEPGAISARCENCHGAATNQGALDMTIPEHVQHLDGSMDCSTCHLQSVVACYNCHFDNEGLHDETVTHQKFASAKFGGQGEASWRFLVNRVMGDGTTKVYPGSMQSLMADVTAKGDGQNDGQGVTFVAIASYYAHSVTRVDALTCDKCHGIENAVRLNGGIPVDVVKWKLAEDVEAAFGPTLASNWQGPKGVIPVPEDTSLLNFDFVDVTIPNAPWVASAGNIASPRVLFKRGADVIHMPEAYVKPLTAAQLQKLANPYRAGVLSADQAHTADYTNNAELVTASGTCGDCHTGVDSLFAGALHNTLKGKDTFYTNNVGVAEADPLQKGFGNYVTVDYNDLPCAECHNAAAWKVNGVDTWPGGFGQHVCTDCHGNVSGGVATTDVTAPVAKNTCLGCHGRQKKEAELGLTDVHMTTYGMGCASCHPFSDLHGDGTADASQLDPGAIAADCETCHTTMAASTTPEHSQHLANVACSTCHAESMVTCHNCHFDNEASDPADTTILHGKFASGAFGGTAASGKAWRYLVNRVMPDGSKKVYPGSMQSLMADRTASIAPGETNTGWTHAAIAPYYSHSITKVNALKCDKCHGIQNAIDLQGRNAIDVITWGAADEDIVLVSSMMATWNAPTGVIPIPPDPVTYLNFDFIDLTNPEKPLTPTGTSSSPRKLFKRGIDSIHMPEEYVTPLTWDQIDALATPQARP